MYGQKETYVQNGGKKHPILKKVGASIIGKQQAEGDPHERFFFLISKEKVTYKGNRVALFYLNGYLLSAVRFHFLFRDS